MSGDTTPSDILEGQRWFLPSNDRKPARTVHEIALITGFVDYADRRGVRRGCSVREFRMWVQRYKARVG